MPMLAGFGPGDEVLVPSYTFVTSASSIMRTGATPVFCEIDETNMLLDLDDVEASNSNTKGIVAVDYAGFGNDYDRINEICSQHNLICIEDAAQGLGSSWNDGPLATHTRFEQFHFIRQKTSIVGLEDVWSSMI